MRVHRYVRLSAFDVLVEHIQKSVTERGSQFPQIIVI